MFHGGMVYMLLFYKNRYINKYLNFLMIINYSEINAENKIPKLLRTFIDGFKKIDIIIFFSYS
jgi:hypothetical protein